MPYKVPVVGKKIDEQCCDPLVLYVIRKNTKSSLEGFNWDTIIIEEIQEVSARFHSTASVPVVHEHRS